MKAFLSRFSLAVGIGALVAGCGGGGGSTASTTTPPLVASTITVANSKDVGAQAYLASDSLNGQVNGGSTLLTGVAVNTAKQGLLDVALDQMYWALSTPKPALAAGITTTQSAFCTGGGVKSLTLTVASPTTITSGDSLVISTINCVENGITVNGSMTISFGTITPAGTVPTATSAWSSILTLTFSNLSVNDGSITNTTSGGLTLTYNQTAFHTATFTSANPAGTTLTLGTTKAGVTTTRTLSSYSYSGSVTPASVYTYSANYTVTGNFARLGNTKYVVTTTTPFVQQGVNFPSQGVMTVKADDNSILTFTVVDTTTVSLGIDTNGDGTNESTVSTTWAELAGLM